MASTSIRRYLPTPTVAFALALRVVLFETTCLPETLSGRIELSTPITGIRYLKDAVYLYTHNLNPYEAGTFHHSPLYLLLFSVLPIGTSSLLSSLFFTLIDYVAARSLRTIWECRKRKEDSRLKKKEEGVRWLRDGWEEGVMLLYLLNPYSIASCLARSTTSIDNALVLLSISSALSGKPPLSTFFLSLSTHTSLYPILLLPLILIAQKSTRVTTAGNKDLIGTIFLFGGFFLALTALGHAIVGGWSWVGWTWETILTVSDLTPNVGLNWYFFTEMFDHFRTFFVGALQMHIAVYVAPMCIRLYHQPLLGIAVMCGIISTFKSYPTLGDAALWLGLLGCFPDIWADLRHPLLTFALQLYSSILLPILHSLWLESGTGNANFFYAATLVYGLGCGMGIVDMLGAGLRAEAAKKVVESGSLEEGGRRTTESGEKEKVRIAKLILEERDLVIVQYAGLEDE